MQSFHYNLILWARAPPSVAGSRRDHAETLESNDTQEIREMHGLRPRRKEPQLGCPCFSDAQRIGAANLGGYPALPPPPTTEATVSNKTELQVFQGVYIGADMVINALYASAQTFHRIYSHRY